MSAQLLVDLKMISKMAYFLRGGNISKAGQNARKNNDLWSGFYGQSV